MVHMIRSLSTYVMGASTGLAMAHTAAYAAPPPKMPFPQHVVYAAGTIKPDNYRQPIMDGDVRRFYAWWKGHYLIDAGRRAGRRMYRIGLGKRKSGATVSEGQGYGMIIVALMAGHDPQAKRIFDGLLAFTLAHPSEISPALMAWKSPSRKGDGDSAFDGDADIAYALMLADAQWGSNGRINYRRHAKRRLTALKKSSMGHQLGLPLLGDWVRSNDNDINETMARTSDFMPAHFASFARFTSSKSWRVATQRTRATMSAMQAALTPLTGLVPDFVTHLDQLPKAASAHFLETINDGDYYMNAARVPWRIGTDALINGSRASIAQVSRISAWIERNTGGDPRAIRAGYSLNGKPLPNTDYFSALFAAPFGVAAMANPAQQGWLNAVYAAVRQHHEGYYEDSVTLLSLLVMTGNYWDPTRVRKAGTSGGAVCQAGRSVSACPTGPKGRVTR